ncbi:MAG TPA: hypothetical protein PLV50_10745 [Smithella sp.]|nr:hypothetical protein [Smithella sp.]NMD02860.1 hypothetical protein [Bacteroidales bacterium]MDM7985819.1 hypothetical protein [Smithella sp.]HNY50801.1 hypothetical protein [Smithella sp.]HOG91008.1 hypothetical protein [Smithella sp.]
MKKIKYVHTVLLIVLFAFFLVNCSSGGGDSDDSENHGNDQVLSETYGLNVIVTGTNEHVWSLNICVKYDNRGGNDYKEACLSEPLEIGNSGTITANADPGMDYEVEIPFDEPALPYCSITSGGSGVFGSNMPDIVVECN